MKYKKTSQPVTQMNDNHIMMVFVSDKKLK